MPLINRVGGGGVEDVSNFTVVQTVSGLSPISNHVYVEFDADSGFKPYVMPRAIFIYKENFSVNACVKYLVWGNLLDRGDNIWESLSSGLQYYDGSVYKFSNAAPKIEATSNGFCFKSPTSLDGIPYEGEYQVIVVYK